MRAIETGFAVTAAVADCFDFGQSRFVSLPNCHQIALVSPEHPPWGRLNRDDHKELRIQSRN